jgi:hypothetical protein
MRVMLNSSSGTGARAVREAACLASATFENEKRKTPKSVSRHAYVQERRRNPCDQLCTTTVEDTTHNRVGSDRSW